MREYDLIAEWYASERRDRTGVPEVLAVSDAIAPGSRVLDAGCGNGIPLTRALIDRGHRPVGVDSAGEMLTRFRTNCPSTPAVRARVQSLPFAGASFDAAIMWGVMFHLPQTDQRAAIASVARVLKRGAPFLFTSADVDEAAGHIGAPMNGVDFVYYSFTLDDYRRILAEHDLEFVDFHADDGGNGYYLARKR
ncbi:MAG TPA: class I SAM-dependent methyltransferase [Vicinamibacterales bacterium]|nr:class I SAM-dependent methyltransferase [Vicinamibacterales bacterium]